MRASYVEHGVAARAPSRQGEWRRLLGAEREAEALREFVESHARIVPSRAGAHAGSAPMDGCMPGPPPKPAAIRRRDGNPSKRPIPDEARIGVVVSTAGAFVAPPGLPAEVAAVWAEFVPELVEIGMVRSIDALMLESLCRHVARAREADAYLDALGLHRSAAPVAMCRVHVELGASIAEADGCEACAHERDAPPMPAFMHQGHRGATVHPAARVARDSWAAALKLASEYGMTAVGRLRVGAAVLQQKSLAAELKEALDGAADDEVEGALAQVLDGDA